MPTGPTLPPSAVSNPGMILSGSPVDVPKPKGSDLTSGAGGSGSEGSVSPSPARRGGTGRSEGGVFGRGGCERETGEGPRASRRGEARRGAMRAPRREGFRARRWAPRDASLGRGEDEDAGGVRDAPERRTTAARRRAGKATRAGPAAAVTTREAEGATSREDARATTRVAGRTMDDTADIVASSSRGAAATGRGRGPSGSLLLVRSRPRDGAQRDDAARAPSRHLTRPDAKNLSLYPALFRRGGCLPRGCSCEPRGGRIVRHDI